MSSALEDEGLSFLGELLQQIGILGGLLGLTGGGWQFNHKEAPGTGLTVDESLATVGLGDTLDDGQT
jgi:hypothetical protein